MPSGRELRTLGNYHGFVALAFSPDGLMLASSVYGDVVKLWDVASGGELRTFGGRSDVISSVAYSPDGRILASGSFDATVKLWDVASGRELRSLSGKSGGTLSVAFSPDGGLLAAGYQDNTIKLWDVASGRELRTLTGHTGSANSVVFSRDGRELASGGQDQTIRLWDVASGRELSTIRDGSSVISVALSQDGQVLVSGGYGTTVKLWDVASGRELLELSGYSDRVLSVAFSPDGHSVAAATGGTIGLWDVATGRPIAALRSKEHSYYIEIHRVLGGWPDASRRNSITRFSFGTCRAGASCIRSSAISFRFLRRILAGRQNWRRAAAMEQQEWDVASGSERVAFVGFNDGTSIAITPEGYYDASSAAAEENLNVRVGNQVFSIGSYREKFYRPDLVRLALAGGSLARFGSIGSEKAPPIVELVDLPPSTSEPKLNVTLRLTDGGGGIGLVRVFLNGSAIIQDDTATPPGGPVTRSYAVPLLNGPNQLGRLPSMPMAAFRAMASTLLSRHNCRRRRVARCMPSSLASRNFPSDRKTISLIRSPTPSCSPIR